MLFRQQAAAPTSELQWVHAVDAKPVASGDRFCYDVILQLVVGEGAGCGFSIRVSTRNLLLILVLPPPPNECNVK